MFPDHSGWLGLTFFSLSFLQLFLAIATYLIHGSFANWADSPFTSTVTTKKISSLDFPKVSVCLPGDLGIALSYDLKKTANMNITDQQKETLAAEATKIFIQDPAWENFPKMLEISNIENAEHIFKGSPELMNNVFGVVIIAYHSHFPVLRLLQCTMQP